MRTFFCAFCVMVLFTKSLGKQNINESEFTLADECEGFSKPIEGKALCSSGVRWTEGLNWQQVKEKAKMENKFIFFDCYATWCGPCKTMDKNVYTDSMVGQFMNDKFICVKVQLDRTEYDDNEVKKWYTEASMIQSYYSVTSFPTFLFFSPNGTPLHKGVGYKRPDEFIELAKETFNPDKQYYRLVNNFLPGKMDTSGMKWLARSFRSSDRVLAGKIAADYLMRIGKSELQQADNLGLMSEFNDNQQVSNMAFAYLKEREGNELCESKNVELIKSFEKDKEVKKLLLSYIQSLPSRELSKSGNVELLRIFKDEQVVKDIVNGYLGNLDEEELFNFQNILLLAEFTSTSKDRGFHLFYHQGERVRDVVSKQTGEGNVSMSPNTAEIIVDKIIRNEEIGPYWDDAKKDKKVNWRKISSNIRKKYSAQHASRVVLNAKVNLYWIFSMKYNRHWKQYLKYNIRKIEDFGTDTTNAFHDAIVLNNFAWEGIFLHSNNKKQLNTAIKWMEGVLRRHPDDYGYMDTYANLLYKAGKKQQAIEWEEAALRTIIDNKLPAYVITEYKKTIDRMKKGEPTWSVPASDEKKQ